MRVVIRADASIEIGIGHVMRCVTLANALQDVGFVCSFVCADQPGNLIQTLRAQGYDVAPISVESVGPTGGTDAKRSVVETVYEWAKDAKQTIASFSIDGTPDWVVVDHYALDERWSREVRARCRNLLVIDDLANRRHSADVLLDQTFGRKRTEYLGLVNPECQILCGTKYVLLRKEFHHWRASSLANRKNPKIRRILVSLGGVDSGNITRNILLALSECDIAPHVHVVLVLGHSCPWIDSTRQLIKGLKIKIELKLATRNMAELLANTDLAIGAGGTSTWERCYLGVPTIMVVLADNQREIASKLSAMGAVKLIGTGASLKADLDNAIRDLHESPSLMQTMARKSAELVSGQGARRVSKLMLGM